MNGVYTTGDVARLTHVATRTVVLWCKSGVLESYLIPGGQHRRITRDALTKFLAANSMPTIEEFERMQADEKAAERQD